MDLNGLNLYYLNGGSPKQFFHGDANLDGAVNIIDLGVLSSNYEGAGKDWSSADFNGDGVVNVVDLGVLSSHYGSATAGGGAEPIPEPASAVLILAGLLPLWRRRGRHRRRSQV